MKRPHALLRADVIIAAGSARRHLSEPVGSNVKLGGSLAIPELHYREHDCVLNSQ